MSESLTEIIEKVLNRSDVHSTDIPSLDLYIDQIITLLDNGLENNKRNEKDKILTKTMVNNYSKQGIIQPIKGKKYSKEHIIQMLMVYALKNTLSIDEIKRTLNPIYHQTEENKVDLIAVYDRFIELKSNNKNEMADMMKVMLDKENLDLDNESDRLVAILCFSALSEFSKIVVEEMIDRYYPNSK